MRNLSTLEGIAQTLVAPGKGILAADESMGTCDKRFDAYGIPKTAEMRRQWRQLLFSTPGIQKGLSGVILFDETVYQKADDGTPFPLLLAHRGILPGIKVDQGLELFGSAGEKMMKEIEGLPARLKEYADNGMAFTKARAVITIGEGLPTQECLRENARYLVRCGIACQEAGLVPILEPEVLLDGTHTLARSEEVLTETLDVLFEEGKRAGLELNEMLLKSSMALPGKDSGQQVSDDLIAEATLRAFTASVPALVPGIVFLSGGQTPKQATTRLNTIVKKAGVQKTPWAITFSYSRALQEPVLAKWQGKAEHVQEAQQIFRTRVEETSAASLGEYNTV